MGKIKDKLQDKLEYKEYTKQFYERGQQPPSFETWTQYKYYLKKGLPERYKAQAEISPYLTAAGALPAYAPYKAGKEVVSLLGRMEEIEKGTILDPEAYAGEATGLAMLGLVGGAPGGLPKGATGAGIFYGAKGAAKAKKVSSLKDASLRLFKKGESAKTVREQTGWFKSAYDKRWRFELDDSKAKLLNPKQWKLEQEYDRQFVAKLGDIYQHSELYKAYPELYNMPVEIIQEKGIRAAYSPKTKTFQIGRDSFNFAKKKPEPYATGSIRADLTHEIQHAVQEIEGFAKGASPTITGETWAYIHSAGEIEAREAARRWGLRGRERIWGEPYEMSIPPSEAIIRK